MLIGADRPAQGAMSGWPTAGGRCARARLGGGNRALLMSSHDFRHPELQPADRPQPPALPAAVRDGVVIGTRPAINLAVAHVVSPSVVRVGQDHMNLAHLQRRAAGADPRRLPAARPRLDAHRGRRGGLPRPAARQARASSACPTACRTLGGRRAPLDDKVVVAAGPGDAAERVRPAAAGVGEGGSRAPGLGAADLGRRARIGASCAGRPTSSGSPTARRLMGFTPQLHEEFADSSMYVMSSRKRGLPDGPARGDGRRAAGRQLRLPDGAARHHPRGRRRPRGAGRRRRRAGRGDERPDGGRGPPARRSAPLRSRAPRDTTLGTIVARWEALLAEIAAAKTGRPTTLGAGALAAQAWRGPRATVGEARVTARARRR